MSKTLRGLALLGLGLCVPLSSALAQGEVHTPRVHALTHVRIVQAPGRVVESGTVVIRDGLIEAAGASVPVPADARVWEHDSLTVYAGLIDLAMDVSPPEKDEDDKAEDLTHELEVVRPDFSAEDDLVLSDADRKSRRGQGILTVRVLPDKGVLRGRAALLNLGDGDLGKNLLQGSAGQVLAFAASGDRGTYPSSLMGAVAVLRQTLYDTRWYARANAVYAADPRGKERPEANAAFAAFGPAMKGDERIIFVTRNVLDLLRAGGIGKEFDLDFQYVGSGEEYRRMDDVRDLTRELVVPVDFPKPPSVGDEGPALAATTGELRAWADAPANPARLHAAGVTFALSARGLKDVGSFRKNVGKAIEAGLPEEAALAAATTVPAEMAGVANRLGTVEAGKIANLVVADGDLFDEKTKIREVWIDGARYELEDVKPPEGDPRGTWEIKAEAGDGSVYPSTLVLAGEVGSLTGTLSMMGNDIDLEVTQSGSEVRISFDATAIGIPGKISMTLEIKGDKATGSGESPMGTFTVTGKRTGKPGRNGASGGGNE